jgi:hypothetical protein
MKIIELQEEHLTVFIFKFRSAHQPKSYIVPHDCVDLK